MHIWIEPSPVTQKYGSVGPSELRADGGGQAEAHRAQAAGRHELAGAKALEELGGPHLVLADIGDDDGIMAGHGADLLDDVLAVQDAIVGVVQRVVRLPLLRCARSTRGAGRAGRL